MLIAFDATVDLDVTFDLESEVERGDAISTNRNQNRGAALL